MDPTSDEELMLRVQQASDLSAFEELFSRYRVRITSYTSRLVGEAGDGESLAQETFLRLLEKRALYSYPRRFSTWLFTIARNLVTDFQKKKRASTSENFDLMADSRGDPQTLPPDLSSMEAEALRSLQAAIDQLPPRLREVLILRAFYDMSYREIAEVAGCPESTARSRMDVALKELKRSCQGL
jgi:RNA polymerase sigma-70 factor (ECF subfamily)